MNTKHCHYVALAAAMVIFPTCGINNSRIAGSRNEPPSGRATPLWVRQCGLTTNTE